MIRVISHWWCRVVKQGWRLLWDVDLCKSHPTKWTDSCKQSTGNDRATTIQQRNIHSHRNKIRLVLTRVWRKNSWISMVSPFHHDQPRFVPVPARENFGRAPSLTCGRDAAVHNWRQNLALRELSCSLRSATRQRFPHAEVSENARGIVKIMENAIAFGIRRHNI